MSGLHESAAGDTPMDRKLRILEYFLRSTPLEEDKVFLKGLIRDTTTHTNKIVANGFSECCCFDFSFKFSNCQQYYFPRR